MNKHIVLIVFFKRPYIIVVKITQALGSHACLNSHSTTYQLCKMVKIQSVINTLGLNYTGGAKNM